MAPTTAVARQRRPGSGIEASARALVSDLRHRGFDLRRPVFIAYLVELKTDRDVAYLLWRRAVEQDWRSSLYADHTGWVVRLGRLVRPRVEALARAGREARELAAAYDGNLRGVSVEDLTAEDVWSRLADRVRHEQVGAGDAATAASVVALRRPA